MGERRAVARARVKPRSAVRSAANEGGLGDEHVFRVAEVNRVVKAELESTWGSVWIVGEISEITRAASGHRYFTLTDPEEPAQLRCVMFRGDAERARAQLEVGAEVRFRGKLSIYGPRGSFQFVARSAVDLGAGDLQAQFERLRSRLEAEGLFAADRKRGLPLLPRTVAVVTSAQGAALHDVLQVARRRCPVRIVVVDCRVQGDEAPGSIVRALSLVERWGEAEVIIMGRGGGAAEDLAAFNDERVARAVVAATVPVVSAVGHEVDVTIADLVADVRAATPSNAAELVVPEREVLRRRVEDLGRRAEQCMDHGMARRRAAMGALGGRVTDPYRALAATRSRLDQAAKRLDMAMARGLQGRRAHAEGLVERVRARDPRAVLRVLRQRWERSLGTLLAVGRSMIAHRGAPLRHNMAKLDSLSPLAVLGRGFGIVLRDGVAVRNASEVSVGDEVEVRLTKGGFVSTVDRVEREEP